MSSDSVISAMLKRVIITNPLTATPKTRLATAIAMMCQARLEQQSAQIEADDSPSLNHPQLANLATIVTDPAMLADARAGCILILNGQTLVGTLTEQDVVRLLAFGYNPKTISLADVMTPKPIVLHQSMPLSLSGILELITQHQVRHLPLIDSDGKVLGILTPEALRQNLQVEDLLQLRSVAEVMATQVVQAPLNTSLQALSQQMADYRAETAVILDQDQSWTHLSTPEQLSFPVGIVSEQDLVQFCAIGLDFRQVQARVVMQTPLICLSPQDSLWAAHTKMQRYNTKHLTVIGDRGEFLGLITKTHLIQALNPLDLQTGFSGFTHQNHPSDAEKVAVLERQTKALETAIQERTSQLHWYRERDRLLNKVLRRPEHTSGLIAHLQSIVSELRPLLRIDRLLVYQVMATGVGEVIAEAHSEKYPSILGQSLADTPAISTLNRLYGHSDSTHTIPDLSRAPLPKPHQEALQHWQVRAQIVAPILVPDLETGREIFWGLLWLQHCRSTRRWQPPEQQFAQLLALHLAGAIYRASLVEELGRALVDRHRMSASLQAMNQAVELLATQHATDLHQTNQQLQQAILDQQQALHRSEATNRALLDAIPDLLIRMNYKGDYLEIIPAKTFKTLLQPLEEIQGRNVLDVLPQDLAQERVQAIRRALNTGEIQIYEFQVLMDGENRTREARIAKTGESEVLVIVRDVTDRKQVEQDLLHALEQEKELSDLRSRFVSTASHEFRTPMSIISSSVGLLSQYHDRLEDRERRKYLDKIQTAVDRMTHLLEDLLVISQAQTGELQFNPQPLDLVDFCHSLIEELSNTQKPGEVQFSHQGEMTEEGAEPQADRCRHAQMDRRLLHQVFKHLLSNALKYSPQDRPVVFNLQCTREHAIFQIRDEGIGIPPEDRSRLFNSFHRGRNVGDIPGTGLGLAIVQQCIQIHQGSIQVASEPMVGTRITVTLPLRASVPEEATSSNQAASSSE